MYIIFVIRLLIYFSVKYLNYCFKELFINVDNVNIGS